MAISDRLAARIFVMAKDWAPAAGRKRKIGAMISGKMLQCKQL
jgi:hypothetical protein